MAKIMICMSILFIAGFATLKLIDIQVDADSGLPNVVAEDKKVRDQVLHYFAFKQSFEATHLALHRGEITLADACERVNRLAKHYHSAYLLHIGYAEKGTSHEERVARNLIGHVALLDEKSLSSEPRVPQLQVELAEFLKNLASKH